MSQTFEIVLNGRPVVFTSPYDDVRALTKRRGYVNLGYIRSNFARALAERRTHTRKQMAWIHKLVLDYEAPQEGSTRNDGFPRVFRG